MEEAAEEGGPGCLLRGVVTFRQEVVGGADAGLTGLDPYEESVTLGPCWEGETERTARGKQKGQRMGALVLNLAKNSAVFPGLSFPICKRRDCSNGLSSPRCCGAPHGFRL